jgi:apolipoprotein N-acyltransferase
MSKFREIVSKYKNIILLFISSFLVFLSYPKISISEISFISLIPYIIVIFNLKTKKEALKYGFIYGFFTYLFILYWIFPTLKAGDVNTFIAISGVALLSSIMSVEFIIITFFGYLSKNCSVNMMIFLMPSVFVIVDFIKTNITRYLPYFPWFQLGYSQWNNIYFLNLAGLAQVYSITFVIVLVNSLLASIIIEKENGKRIRKLIIAFLILFISFYIGRLRFNDLEKAIAFSDKKINIVVMQPSIDFYMKWNISYVEDIKARIEKLLKEASSLKPDLIIWPENSLYGWIDDPDVFNWLCKNIKETQTYHIVGSISKTNRRYVSSYLISPKCQIIGEYNKRVLVPFGEYVPLRNILGKFIGVIGELGEFEKGNYEQKPFNLKSINIGQTICYETAFDYLFYPDDDVDLFVNITNDGWYLNTSAPYQHFAIAVVRAVENGRYLVRAANNGISAVISPNGAIIDKLNLNEYKIMHKEIKITQIKRQSDIEKNVFVFLSFIIFISFLMAMIFR